MNPSNFTPLRRRAGRGALRRAATLTLHGQPPRALQTWEVSEGGMALLSARPVSPGTRCGVAFDIPSSGADKPVRATVKVLHSSFIGPEGFRIGVTFVELDSESADAIRAFVVAL